MTDDVTRRLAEIEALVSRLETWNLKNQGGDFEQLVHDARWLLELIEEYRDTRRDPW